MSKTLTTEQVRELPVVLDPASAARLLGIGRTTVYALLERGEFPAPAFRIGRRWRIPTAGVCALLGIAYPPPGAGPTHDEGNEGEGAHGQEH